MNVRERLKSETRDLHEQLEGRLDLLRSDFSRRDLVRLLERFYGYHSPCEQQIEQLEEPLRSELDGRRRVGHLTDDLLFFGHTEESLSALPCCPVAPQLDLPTALGRWYVLEGSTLGGQLLVRHFHAQFGLAEDGLRYFRSYGPAVGQRWTEYCRTLEQFSAPDIDDGIIAAARETFATLTWWLP